MRGLQAPRCYIAGGDVAEPIFILDGAVSERLFASGFWKRINSSWGTMFDQFEDDEAAPTILLQIASELESCVRSLHSQSGDTVCFVCGWSPRGTPTLLRFSGRILSRNGSCYEASLLRLLPAGKRLNSVFDCGLLAKWVDHGPTRACDLRA